MRLFDAILRLFFNGTEDAYQEIVKSHWEAYLRWIDTLAGIAFNDGHGQPSLQDKRYVVAHKEEILRLEEEMAYESRRAAVIQAGKSYPVAFLALARRLSIASFSAQSVSKDGHSLERSICNLERSEYERLYAYIGSLQEETEKLRARFDQEVLGNKIRSKYHNAFLKGKGVDGEDIGYLLEHLDELDDYCHLTIDAHYELLRKKYPLGLAEFRKRTSPGSDDYQFKATVLDNILKVYHWDCDAEERQSMTERGDLPLKEQEELVFFLEDCLERKRYGWDCQLLELPNDALGYEPPSNLGYRVCQLICKSYLDERSHFNPADRDKVAEFVICIKRRFGNVCVVIGDGIGEEFSGYLRKQLAGHAIWVTSMKIGLCKRIASRSRYIVLIDSFSTNERTLRRCERIISWFDKGGAHITCIALKEELTLPVAQGKKERKTGKRNPEAKLAEMKDLGKQAKERETARRYEELRKKYPKGLPAYVDYYSYDDGKNSAGPTEEEIVRCEEEIARFEQVVGEKEVHKAWIEKQEAYAAYCRELRDECVGGWGCHKYTLSVPSPSFAGETTFSSYPFWQLFCESYCPDSSLDYFLMPYQKSRYKRDLPGLLDKSLHYKTDIYDRVVQIACHIKARYRKVLVLLGDSGVKDEGFNEFHLRYLKSKLSERMISFDYAWNDPVFPFLHKYLLLVNVTETNEHMQEECQRIIFRLRDQYPHIVCVTLLKAFSSEEMVSLIKRKEAERNAELEKEEIARREAERARWEREAAQRERDELFQSVASWHMPTRSSVRCFSLYNYYPTKCEWEPDDKEWAIRKLIWDFKASPTKPMGSFEIALRHERALGLVVPDIEKTLRYYFKDLVQKLTLVPIPSSKQAVTERRYQDFSRMVCDALGMANGYPYVHVARDGEAKRLGGTERAEISVDNDFFKGRYVLLFDDVITSGSSMERMRILLQAAGATVIAGLSLGRTLHQRAPYNPIETLSTERLDKEEEDDLDDDLPF